MIDPGRLKTRLAIEAPVETPDGQGGVTRSYTTVATVWAALLPRAASPDVSADAVSAAVRSRIILRRGTPLTLRHRLRDGSDIHRIVTLREIDDGRFIEIDAELRVD